MLRKSYNNKKGVTLIELILVLAILTIVIGSAYSLFSFGSKTFTGGSKQYNAQNSTRLIVDYITKEIRFATDLSVQSVSLSENQITDNEHYSYIYIKNGSLHHSLYDLATNSRNSRVLQGDISEANSSFNKINNSTLGITMTSNGNNQEYFIDTEVNLPNFKLMSASINGTSDLALRYK